jgi:DNA-binding CsgD family transcriptional regulator
VRAIALTAAELRVARLVADGHSTREVAERLFLTQRAVEDRLGQACRKLGVGSPAQLAAALGP